MLRVEKINMDCNRKTEKGRNFSKCTDREYYFKNFYKKTLKIDKLEVHSARLSVNWGTATEKISSFSPS